MNTPKSSPSIVSSAKEYYKKNIPRFYNTDLVTELYITKSNRYKSLDEFTDYMNTLLFQTNDIVNNEETTFKIRQLVGNTIFKLYDDEKEKYFMTFDKFSKICDLLSNSLD